MHVAHIKGVPTCTGRTFGCANIEIFLQLSPLLQQAIFKKIQLTYIDSRQRHDRRDAASEIVADRELEEIPLVVHQFGHIAHAPLILQAYDVTVAERV